MLSSHSHASRRYDRTLASATVLAIVLPFSTFIAKSHADMFFSLVELPGGADTSAAWAVSHEDGAPRLCGTFDLAIPLRSWS